MELVRGVFKIALIRDPEIEPEHFGFEIHQLGGDGWQEIIDYYPTMIPEDADEPVQKLALRTIMDDVHSPLRRNEDIDHRLLQLSLMSPDWFEDEDALSHY